MSLYRAYRSLSPAPAQHYATVIADLGDGRYRVRSPSGEEWVAEGVAQVGGAVWVEGGKIVGEAPVMAAVEVEV